jgi:hypothetical protein
MSMKWILAGALGLSALGPVAATALAAPTPVADEERRWVQGHFETRETKTLIPAVTRQERVPARFEETVVPAVTERVWIPPVTERVWRRGHYGLDGWRRARFEERIIRPGRWETRIVAPERRESRMVADAYWRTVVVTPEHYATSIDKMWVPGHWESR